MKIAVYPGSFDPITNGHLDIIERAAAIFDKVIVAILKNSNKKPLFSVSEREEFIKRATAHLDNVETGSFDGMLVDYVKRNDSRVIVKGLRAVSDFEYEFQMALANKKIDPSIETLFMMTDAQYYYLSSSIVKEMASLGAELEGLVPPCIMPDIIKKFEKSKDGE